MTDDHERKIWKTQRNSMLHASVWPGIKAAYTFEQAVAYAKEHIDEIPIDSDLEYIGDTDELDEENCEFEEIPEGGADIHVGSMKL